MDSPKPPDPMTTANSQTAMNKQTAQTQQQLNMTNQTTPYGSLTYNQNGTWSDGTPKYSADVSLSPQGQSLFDQTNNVLTQSNNNKLQTSQLANTLLGSKTGALSGNPIDLGWSATEAKLDQLNRNTLDPMWQHNTDMEEQKLYDRGVRPGTDAYDNEMRNFNVGKNNAYDQMFLGGHQQAVNDLMQEYNSPLQTYSTLMTSSQPTAPQNPTFQSTPQTGVSPVNYAGLVQQNYNDQVQANSSMMGGLFGLGGTLGGAAMKYGLPLAMA